MGVPLIKVEKNGIIVGNHPLVAPFFSVWNQWPRLCGRSIVIGFIGPRGSCKTTGAVRTLVLDYLLKNRRVWSRLNLGVDLWTPTGAAPLRSIDMGLDFKFSDCFDGCVFMDEVNEDGADAYRSQSEQALELSYDIQELRKGNDGGLSKLDFIWTTQSEMLCNPRLRAQTDIIIKCADYSLINDKIKDIGAYSKWEIWDYSGIITGKEISTKMSVSPIVFTKPWWDAFKTGTKMREKIREEKSQDQTELYTLTSDLASYIIDNERVRPVVLWRKAGGLDRKSQMFVTKILANDFNITIDVAGRYYSVDKDLVNA